MSEQALPTLADGSREKIKRRLDSKKKMVKKRSRRCWQWFNYLQQEFHHDHQDFLYGGGDYRHVGHLGDWS